MATTTGSTEGSVAGDPSDIDALLNSYSLHHSYGPATVLVNQPLIGAENYNSWSRAMIMALSGKNKSGFIDGSIKKPDRVSIAWKCNNDILASWIMNSVSKEIAASIVYKGSVKEVWKELEERFKQSNGPQVFQLRKELLTTSQGSMSVETYYTKLKTIWQNLVDFRPTITCTCDGLNTFLDYLDSEFVMIFLLGLSDDYASIKTQVLVMKLIPSITEVFSLVIQEERQRSAGHTAQVDLVTLLVTPTEKKQSVQPYTRKKDTTRDFQRPMCSHCGGKGHTIERCYKLHGYPPSYKTRNQAECGTSTGSSPKPMTVYFFIYILLKYNVGLNIYSLIYG